MTTLDEYFETIADDVAPIFAKHGWTYGFSNPVTRDDVLRVLYDLYGYIKTGTDRASTGRMFIEVDEHGLISAGLVYHYYGDDDG